MAEGPYVDRTIIEIAILVVNAVLAPVVGWFVRKVNKTGEDLNDYKVLVAQTYATVTTFNRLDEKIDRILERLPPK